ncbi:Transmembrane protein 107 [Exaiptasia diaphana]|nr:Transmembrane protein 107 [Exaiptasia diaphana]
MIPGSLVAVRFLSLVAHLVITVTIFWAKDSNVLACLPSQYSQTEYDSKHTELIVGLSLTLAFLLFEFGGFIGGVSMFNSTVSMLCILIHIK